MADPVYDPNSSDPLKRPAYRFDPLGLGKLFKGGKKPNLTKGQQSKKENDTLQFVNDFKTDPREAFAKYSAQQITFFREEAFNLGYMSQSEWSQIWRGKYQSDQDLANAVYPTPKK